MKQSAPTANRRSVPLLIGCGVLAVVVIVGLIGAAVFVLTRPAGLPQPPPDAAALLVHLTTPLDASDVPLNEPTSIQVEALGTSPIASLELWVDGNPAETKTAPRPDLLQFDASWSWLPDAPGGHTLVARATDAAHHVVTSLVVRVNAAQSANHGALANYPVKQGDTLASIAQKSDSTVQQLAGDNPQLNPNSPIAAGQVISVPSSPKPPKTTPSPTTSPPASSGASPAGSSIPAAPLLSATFDHCGAVLSFVNLADNVDGFIVYRTAPGNPQFAKIATLPSAARNQTTSYTDSNVAGPLEYYVSAFNHAGESPSKIVIVKITDPACATGFPTAPVFASGQVIPAQPVDKVYCYLSRNSGLWSRVPPAPNTFIYPAGGVFDVSAYLNPLITQITSQFTLDLDCWGWKGSTLIYLGEAQQTFAPQPNAPVKAGNDKFAFSALLNKEVMIQNLDSQNQPFIYPPSSLMATSDPTVCSNHWGSAFGPLLGALVCPGVIKKGDVVLVWNWNSGATTPFTAGKPVTDIQGYHIYENDSYFQHSLVDKTLAAPDYTVSMFPLPVIPQNRFEANPALIALELGAPTPKRCFVVTAFKGTLESADSNTICLGAPTSTVTKTFSPANPAPQMVTNVYINDCSGVGPLFFGNVGYQFQTGGVAGCGHENDVVRSLTKFDLGSIGPVWSAILRYHVRDTLYGDNEDGSDPNRLQIPSHPDSNRSCAVGLMLPTVDWSTWLNHLGSNNLVPADDYADLPESGSPPSFEVDVTSAVRRWQEYGNYGFEFRGAREDTGAEENSECWSTVVVDGLDVTYFPQ